MTKAEFADLAKNRILYLDGATGTNLSKAGMPGGVCPEAWIAEHPEAMLELQKSYLAAGSDILYAPTFGGNRVKLAEYGLADRQEELTRTLVGISKRAVAESGRGGSAFVAGDLTMTGQQLSPMGTMELETLIDVYQEQIRLLADAGADLLVVETMMSLAETRAALIAAKEAAPSLPILATLTFEAGGRTLFGTDARTAAIVCESLGADAVGVNCSTGPAAMAGIVREMAGVTRVPIIAKPNAGLPKLDASGRTYYDMDAGEFAEEMQQLADAGATILGGCCGTDAEYIRRIRERFGTEPCVRFSADLPEVGKEISSGVEAGGANSADGAGKTVYRRPDGIRYLTSERKTLAFGLEDAFFIVGERINPTGKKALQAELREGKLGRVRTFAEEQEKCGAEVLDINVGMSGIDEKETMLRVLDEVTQITSLPLAIDSSFVEVVEAALRRYPGRALINSISLETEKFEKLLPIAAKYGAMFILLPLSEAGLPKDLEEKKEIIGKIYARAQELGMRREDIVIDGLVQTVGANQSAGVETLETIRYAKENGFATICGLSNISFGMPERSYVNSAFLTLAIREGLTMAIANPSQELLIAAARASDLLLNKPGTDLAYIETVTRLKEEREEKTRKQDVAMTGGVITASGQTVNRAELVSVVEDSLQAAKREIYRKYGLEALAGELTKSQETASGAPDVASTGTVKTISGDSDASRAEGGNFPQASGQARPASAERTPVQSAVYQAVLKGNRGGIAQLTQDALDAGEDAQTLLNDVLIPAIGEVGEYFDKGKYFLPQLIGSAEAMKGSIELLEPLLAKDSAGEDQPTVVIATVEGDIHDIGKNLVAMMLKNYGFQVIDLGKDVPADEILRVAKEHNAQVIALSALMTTTMQRMKEVVERVRAERLAAKVMIGGAVVTQEYADEIGADGYSADAADAVKLAQKLCQEAKGVENSYIV